MSAKSIIESLFEANPDDYLKSLGIVRHSASPPAPPAPKYNYDKPDEETQLAVKGDLLNDLPEGPDFDEMDSEELLDTWTDTCLGGQRIRSNNIEELFNALGYSDTDEFLQDNEGVIDAIHEFIIDHLERSKVYGEEGWWSMLVEAIKEAKTYEQ